MVGKIFTLIFSIIILTPLLSEITTGQSNEESKQGNPIWIYDVEGSVWDIDISYNGQFTVIGGGDLVVLDNFNKTVLWMDQQISHYDVTFSPDGEYFVASNMFNVYFYRTTSKKPIWKFSNYLQVGGYTDWNKNNGISYNGSYIVARLIDGIYFFEKMNSTPKWHVPGDFNVVDMSYDGRYIVSNINFNTGSILTDDFIRNHHTVLWSKDSPIPVRNYTSDVGSTGTIDISPSGNFIATEWGLYLTLLSTESNEVLWKSPTNGNFESIESTFNGEYIVTGNGDGNIYLFSNEQKGLLWKYETEDVVIDVDISIEGKYLIGGNSEFFNDEETKVSKFYFFENNSKSPIWTFNSTCRSVAISHYGKYIVAGSKDEKIYLFYNDDDVDKRIDEENIELLNIFYIALIIILIAIGTCLFLILIRRKRLKKSSISNKSFNNKYDRKN